MPALCGLVGPVAYSRAPEEHLSRFRRVLSLNGISFLEEFYASDSCTIANFSTGILTSSHPQPGRIGANGAVLFLEGEIFNAPELAKRLGIRPEPGLCPLLLELYLLDGPDFVEKLDGEFNIVIYEPECSKLTIVNDHIASQPMYYREGPDGLVFGSEKKAILANDARDRVIDPVGLLQLFMHRHNLDSCTFIKDLNRLTPATRLTWHENRLAISRYVGINHELSLPKNTEDRLESWADCLTTATAKRVEGKERILFSLSGGLDSRAIACSLDRRKRPIWARTYGVADSLEVRYAQRIAKGLGFEQFIENPADFRYSDAVRQIVWRTEGEIQFRNAISIFSHRKIKERADHIAGGWYGDASSGAHLHPLMFLPTRRASFFDQLFNWYVVYDQNNLLSVFNPHFLAKYYPDAKEAFIRSYDRFGDLERWRAHELWDLYNRQTRMTISSMPIDSHLFEKIRPFCDRNYLSFVMSMPLSARLGQNYYQSLIYRLGPEIRSVPNSSSNVRLHWSPAANLAGYARSAAHRLGRKIARRVRPGFRSRLERRAAFVDLASTTRGDPALRQIVLDFVDSDWFDDSIFDRRRILDLLERHYSGSADISILLCILVTCTVSLPYFVYGNVAGCPPEAEPWRG